ncbi:hypothetical protein HZS55_15110 [Halosimplex rubrum]|uniref:Uncharacterized protein n=1 Tax=Halosimplex rubrum TaxID=869889 RepID=A0A7D5P1S2_9EURY|nr:hypothetical protein [Halosimplex rubrum]QLH78537.1 hypothetical protein HZS55_15110 [Halosimplex rubrum]
MTEPSDGRGGPNGEAGPEGDSRERMDAAVAEIRREAWKAAVTAAAVVAAAVFLGANLVLAALDPAWLPASLPVPTALTESVGSALGRDLGTVAVPGSATVAAAAGAVAFAAAVWLRVREPLVEQFEAVNPAVSEKLRTARDAVEADADSRMARRLYDEVLADLRESSAVGLLNVGRLGAVAVVIAALSLATVQVAVVDLALFDRPEPTTDGSADEPNNYTGLLDGDRVLGDRESVSAGDDNQTAEIESSGGGRDVEDDRTFPDRESSGASGGSSGGVDSQQAEFAAPEQVEDADLVREYNRRIRDGSGDDEDGDDATN